MSARARTSSRTPRTSYNASTSFHVSNSGGRRRCFGRFGVCDDDEVPGGRRNGTPHRGSGLWKKAASSSRRSQPPSSEEKAAVAKYESPSYLEDPPPLGVVVVSPTRRTLASIETLVLAVVFSEVKWAQEPPRKQRATPLSGGAWKSLQSSLPGSDSYARHAVPWQAVSGATTLIVEGQWSYMLSQWGPMVSSPGRCTRTQGNRWYRAVLVVPAAALKS
mmetsp:Transcript_18491/g.59635  ORF Transcript_18491/g.59635 Transcript_18491/m.59635 type:complete len:219 (+) Transcript_18491:686-1342(+)